MSKVIYGTRDWEQVPHGGQAPKAIIDGAARIASFRNDKAYNVEDVPTYFSNHVMSNIRKVRYVQEISDHIEVMASDLSSYTENRYDDMVVTFHGAYKADIEAGKHMNNSSRPNPHKHMLYVPGLGEETQNSLAKGSAFGRNDLEGDPFLRHFTNNYINTYPLSFESKSSTGIKVYNLNDHQGNHAAYHKAVDVSGLGYDNLGTFLKESTNEERVDFVNAFVENAGDMLGEGGFRITMDLSTNEVHILGGDMGDERWLKDQSRNATPKPKL